MGAWIEIVGKVTTTLKNVVAPLVGAWIEIFTIEEFSYGEAVALLVGAWIEIQGLTLNISPLPSLPLWERGLKFYPCAGSICLI